MTENVRPLLTVVKGEPTAEELAALTVVVAALSAQGRPRRRPVPVGAWAAYGDAHRQPLRPGPGGWRAAGRPA
ncbi:acyl-CoA carboxylase subunit epsilon [Geodermatophilus nigrescens]